MVTSVDQSMELSTAVPLPTVFLVDDDEAVRDGLSDLLQTAGYQVSSYARAEDLLTSFDPRARGCVILDVQLPGMRGPDRQAELQRRGSHLPILFLTGHGDIPTTVQAMRAGARDVLVKPVEPDVLLDRIAELVSADVAFVSQQEATRHRVASLTQREREVMVLVAEGLANKEIGERLGISFRTVEVHRAHVMRKTKCTNVIELSHFVAAAREAKLLP